MSADPIQNEREESTESGLPGSNYEIIRARLNEQAGELKRRAETLNTRRQELFGSVGLEVVGKDRIRTDNACIPQDIVAIGDRLLFGYNAQFGLKKTTHVEDVFSLHRFRRTEDGFEIAHLPEDVDDNFLGTPAFVKDFEEIYTYYSGVRLHQLRRTENRLFAILKLGESTDKRVLRWGIEGDVVGYIDNAGHLEQKLAPQHDFDWTPTTRENHVRGKHPHVSILDELFVETIEGDLTIKIEDNTDTGQGILAEPVEDPRQSLNDAEYEYAVFESLILVRILPYREKAWRYFAFNRLTRSVIRLDAIGDSCLQLPEAHGMMVPGGFVLSDGTSKRFDLDARGMLLEEIVRAPNGEDVMYVYHRKEDGLYILQAYNVIRKEVASPIQCHGYSLFDDGTMLVFRFAGTEPTRVHPIQIWQTPFCSDEHHTATPTNGSALANIGNAELVKGISDAFSLCRMVADQKPSVAVYEALIKSAQRAIDNYFWLSNEEFGNLRSVLEEMMGTAELVIDEFRKVQVLKKDANAALEAAEKAHKDILRDVRYGEWTEIQRFVDALSTLRKHRGHLITLKETRHIDVARLDELEQEVIEQFDRLSRATVDFLLGGDALSEYEASLAAIIDRVESVKTTLDAKTLREELDGVNEGLQLLTEVVSGLQVEDPQKRTQMLEHIGEILGQQNRARAMVQQKLTALMEHEGKAEFAVQFQLLSQTVTSALAMADTPGACDEQLTRVMVQLEELESRFSDFDMFLGDLAEKREEIYEVFEGKKQTLLEERQRKVHTLAEAAGRVLQGIERRAKSLKTVDDLNAYFASDPMVMKVRDMARKLRDYDDDVKADDVETRLKGTKDQAIRQLRDKLDLFEDASNVIKLGRHRFSVNTQDVELTLVPRRDQMALHVTGTEFFEPVDDAAFAATEEFWSQHLPSETPDVYRAEYLAACILLDAVQGKSELGATDLFRTVEDPDAALALVRRAVEDRYDEGYERGVHDADAALILERVASLYRGAGVLRFSPDARALAFAYAAFAPPSEIAAFRRRAASLGRLREAYEQEGPLMGLAREATDSIRRFAIDSRLADIIGEQASSRGWKPRHHSDVGERASSPASSHLDTIPWDQAGEYLVEVLSTGQGRPVVSGEAAELLKRFLDAIDQRGARSAFEEDLDFDGAPLDTNVELVCSWIRAHAERNVDGPWEHLVGEAAMLYVTRDKLAQDVSSARVMAEVKGLLGQHPRVDGGKLAIRLDEFLSRLRAFRRVRVPAYRRYREAAHELLARQRKRLRLGELEPKVLTSFVRNRLIDEVYLPLLGDNLAKQLGAAGEEGRSDRSGLLLLISPPGYGKTTLMEYVANRLGLMFMKINGPSLGHDVVSLDPAQAPNATARQEVEKINFALEMGNNVMLYLDDVQHTHPELLQKFISLCDATRRIEGVWKGETQTYDLRGKRFAVVMAGNPYTESGDKFQIPDMLANRADTYNLGDILSGKEDAFEASYVENALTSSPVTAALSTRPSADVDRFMRMARGEQIPLTEFEHGYSPADAQEISGLIAKMLRIRDVVLEVNKLYIKSAAMEDEYRTEPPFQLQGSYRNMNKMVEKLSPVMNEQEVDRIVDNHYQQEAQTLTTGAEQNLLRLGELRQTLSPEQAERWREIKSEFARRKMFGGDDDPVARIAGPLASLVQQLGGVQESLSSTNQLARHLDGIKSSIDATRTHAEKSRPASNGASVLADAKRALQEARLEVSLVGDVPGRLAEMLDHQLAIIESALVPLAKAVHSQLQERDDTQVALRELLAKLDGIELDRPAPPHSARTGTTAARPASSSGSNFELPRPKTLPRLASGPLKDKAPEASAGSNGTVAQSERESEWLRRSIEGDEDG